MSTPSAPATYPRSCLVVALLLLVAAAAGFGAWRWWERAQAGEFTADPHSCELVTPETIHRLVPTALGGREDAGACTWSAPRVEGTYRSNVHLLPFRLTVDLAREDLRETRADETGWEKDTAEDVPGIGEEAFLRFRKAPPGGPASAQVCFRRSNMVVWVAYARADDDRRAARAGAIDAAREAASRLRAG
ncbi:hypothetical protein ACFTWH_09950 [Streptomyces sp. NPDC057011]|uniref:hypothetical protein n=1 Tax=unclassified Streptomyces TaxID=2593676 RepID=UPI00362753D0